MELSRRKINVILARKKMSVTDLAKAYGVSRSRINVILNSKSISTASVGRMADTLNVDVTEIIE